MYVDIARTYASFVRNKRKIFHDIPGYIFITTYRNCIASRVHETCSQLCMFEKCLILLRPSAKMTFHCYLQWIWGPINLTVSLFFLEHVSRSCHKTFWKHLWETPSQTCISFCGTAVLAWYVPSLELCFLSVNSKGNGAQSCLAPLQYSNWCVSIVFSKLHKGFLHSCHLQSRRMSHVFLYKLHRLETCCVAPTMCASARNMMLRSTDHVCKCKENDVA